MKNALYPGTFDPLTNGHLDIIERAAKLFDRVIVTVARNSRKSPLFTVEERVEMIREAIRQWPNVTCESFDGLIVDFAREQKASVLIRGLRTVSDFESEMQMAQVNRRLADELVTIFMMPEEKYTYLNSSIVKEIASYGGDIRSFVPAEIEQKVMRKYGRK
jgi:pantetheine-phosphate adenylyltransferase